MKILFVAQNLQMGGIQKALINTLKELSIDQVYEIDLFLFGKGKLMSEIPPSVNVYTGNLLLELISTPFSEIKKNNNKRNVLLRIFLMLIVRLVGSNNLYRFLFKRQENLREYEMAISYFNDVPKNYFNRGTNLYVAEFVRAERKYAWIHTDPIKANFDYYTCLKTYEKFDRLVCVSEACRKKFVDFLPLYKEKTKVIYNFFPIDEIHSRSLEEIPFEKGSLDIISVGRIDNSSKSFHLIPQLCRLLKNSSITNFRWRIVGDGPDLDFNKKIVEELDVGELVEFVGEHSNPYPFIYHSDLFVLTSAYEGYPMVIGEALILQTPVITTEFAASREQIRHGYNGIITDTSIDDLYLVIKNVIEQPIIIEQMKQFIAENKYTNDTAYKQFVSEFGRSEL